MPSYLATVDVSDGHGGVHWYGVIYEPPVITRSISSGDAITGFVEHMDCEWEMFPREASGRLGDFTQKWIRDEFQGRVVQAQFRDVMSNQLTTEWTGTIQEDSLVAHGGVRLRGTAFPYEALTQRLPWPVITLTDWPNAVDVGKTPPYILGTVKKLKLLYVNDGGGGTYDYMLMLGNAPAAYPSLFKDTVNRGATLPSGVQSFQGVPPGDVSVVGNVSVAGGAYLCVLIRFTTRQVNEHGALIGIYADFTGDGVAFSSPVAAVRTVLTHNTGGLYGPGSGIDSASFDAAETKFNALVAPRTVNIDGVLGVNNQPVAIGDILRPLLKACNGYLGVNTSGQFTMNIDGPPTTYKMALGAGPTTGLNNLIEPGTRRRTALGDRPKRFVLDYAYDHTTGTHQFQRIKSILGTKGRDITTAIPYIVRHDAADLVADRLARIQRNSEDVIEGTAVPWMYNTLNEGDVFLYTWLPHGCEDEPRKAIRVRKGLDSITIDHRRYEPEWDYTPTALPPQYENPENNPPVTTPPTSNVLIEDTGAQRIFTGEMVATSTYQTMITIAITIDTAGRVLKKWGFVEVCSSAAVIGGMSGSATVRLRNVTTGANVEVTKALGSNTWLFPGQTVFSASFPSAELAHNETVAAAGGQTIVLELKASPAQTLYYGSTDALFVGYMSSGYLRAQEWTP